ncbi:hypothetical protein J437_LFUL000161 [Ladona fulva]|uniref:Uncharacterized protein n=1 Tax=Ladona fulva TaxID=123851 RepID=A0A8K0KAA4_LADFU|nr:hypothetical protein J437_LFUL000161 [Ladona fulva]
MTPNPPATVGSEGCEGRGPLELEGSVAASFSSWPDEEEEDEEIDVDLEEDEDEEEDEEEEEEEEEYEMMMQRRGERLVASDSGGGGRRSVDSGRGASSEGGKSPNGEISSGAKRRSPKSQRQDCSDSSGSEGPSRKQSRPRRRGAGSRGTSGSVVNSCADRSNVHSSGRRRKTGLSARERNLRRLESNERERMRMHSLNDAFEVMAINE